MRRRTRIACSALIVLLILCAGAIATVRVLVQPVATGLVDFAELKRSATGNDALACAPEFLCSAKVDLMIAPVAMSAAALAARIEAFPDIAPRTIIVAADEAEFRYVLVQRSALFNLPDTINIAIQPLDAAHAALAIYSRSWYGGGGPGSNMQRVQLWLDLLGVAVVG